MSALFNYNGSDPYTVAGMKWRGGSRLLVVYHQGPKWIKAVEVSSLEHLTLPAEEMRWCVEVEARAKTRFIMQGQVETFKRLNREAKAGRSKTTPCPFNEAAAAAAIEALRGA